MSPLKKWQALMFTVTFLAMVTRHACLASWSISKTNVHDEEGFSKAELGYFDTSFLFFYAIGNFISGVLGDNYPLRFVTAGGMIIATGAYLAVTPTQIVFFGYSGISSFPAFMVFWAICGFAQSAVWPGGVAVISNWFPKHTRGKVMGFWSSNASVGDVVGQQIGGLMLGVLGANWKSVMLVNAIMLGASAILFALLVRDKPSSQLNSELNRVDEELLNRETGQTEQQQTNAPEKFGEDKPKKGISFWKAWLLPGVAIYAFGYACVKMLNYAFILWLPYYLESDVKVQGVVLSAIASLYDIGGIVGSIVSGHYSDKIGYRSFVMLPMLAMSIPIMGVFRLGTPDTFWIYFILVPIVGIMTGGPSNIISSAIAADLAQTPDIQENQEALATVAGIIDGTGGFGAAFGQTFIGLIATASWDMVFVFLMGKDYAGIAFLSLLTMSPMLFREVRLWKAARKNAQKQSVRPEETD
mmetsp:Transcript_10592/g.20421  ORF Transcript_10592/g.20421 Transcript_10592/m.20421 type:complete len:470 (+) Transcript_10592:232-1641(+)